MTLFLLSCAKAPPPVSAEPVDWLPAGTMTVVRSAPAQNPLIAWASSRGVPCLDAAVAGLDVVYQIQRAPPEKMYLVGFGTANRQEAETCAQTGSARLVPGAANLGLELKRDGEVTTFLGPEGGQQVAAFDSGRVVWADTRDEVDAVRVGPHLSPDNPLVALLPRLAGDGMHAVSTADYAIRLTGVRSTGLVVTSPGPGGGEARLQFGSADDAARAFAALQGLANDPAADPTARELPTLLGLQVQGAEIVVDIQQLTTAMTARPDLAARLQALVAPQATP